MTRFVISLLVCATLALAPLVATAAVSISNDPLLPASTDLMNISTDPLTGLDWLDPSATLGQSFNTVTGRFVTDPALFGFSYATRDQVITFLSHLPTPQMLTSPVYASVVMTDGGGSYGVASAYFGTTYVDLQLGDAVTYGLTADPQIAFPDNQYLYTANRIAGQSSTHANEGAPRQGTDATVGSWLILASAQAAADVPEPASIVLWGVLACCGVASVRLRRRTTESRGR